MNKRKANVSGSYQITHYFGTPAAKKPDETSLTLKQEGKSTEQRDTSDKLSEPPAVETSSNPVNTDFHLPTIDEFVGSFNEWKLKLPSKEQLDKLARSKKLKWRAAYRPVWKTEFPWINEVKIDGEVKGIVCGVCRERLADININIDEDLQLKRSGGKVITVPFTKFGDFYEAAKEHEFGNKGRLDHRDSKGNLLNVKAIKRKIEQGVIPAPKTTHMNIDGNLQLHSRNVAVKEDNTISSHIFRLNQSLVDENQQAYEILIAMLHRLVKTRDAPFASLKDGVCFAVEIMKCDYLKRVITSKNRVFQPD